MKCTLPSLNIFELLTEEIKKIYDNFRNQILAILQTGEIFGHPVAFGCSHLVLFVAPSLLQYLSNNE